MLKSNESVINIESGAIRKYICPGCYTEWFEYVDADGYPEYCPHCGKDFDDMDEQNKLPYIIRIYLQEKGIENDRNKFT